MFIVDNFEFDRNKNNTNRYKIIVSRVSRGKYLSTMFMVDNFEFDRNKNRYKILHIQLFDFSLCKNH